MTDVKLFAKFYHAMDWEGGLEGIIRHGFDETGDPPLDNILEQLEGWLNAADLRISEIMHEHGDEVDDYGEEL